MRPHLERRAVAVVVLVFGLLLTACTGSKECTLIGATSGVWFDLTPVLTDVSGHVQVRACAEGTCVNHRASSSRWTRFSVDEPSFTSSRTVDVIVVVRAADAPVYEGNGRVDLRTYQPNGPDCPPTAFRAAVMAMADGRLVQQQGVLPAHA